MLTVSVDHTKINSFIQQHFNELQPSCALLLFHVSEYTVRLVEKERPRLWKELFTPPISHRHCTSIIPQLHVLHDLTGCNALIIPDSWKQATFEQVLLQEKATQVLICGNRNTGKSTYARYL